jgi:hypothetical protein
VKRPDHIVTVCSACRTANCWHGEFMCQAAATASTERILASSLRKLKIEHPSNYSVAKLRQVCGHVERVANGGRS